MKNNQIKTIGTVIAIGLIAAFAGMEVTGDILTGVSVGVAYLAAVSVMAMAAADYRGNQRNYGA